MGNHDLAKGIKNAGQNLIAMNVYDENGRELMSAQLKRQTLNVTLPRQSLLEIIKSYVQPSSIYTEHVVTGLEQTNSKVTVHFSEQRE